MVAIGVFAFVAWKPTPLEWLVFLGCYFYTNRLGPFKQIPR